MDKFHISKVHAGDIHYISIDFEDVVDKDYIKTQLNSLGYIKKANVSDDNYGKIRAIVYLHEDTDENEIVDKLKESLTRI